MNPLARVALHPPSPPARASESPAGGVSALTAALARLADGDRAAFDVVHAEARPLVERFVRRALFGAPCDWATDGDEIMQRTLIRVFEECGRFDPRRSGEAWVVTLAAFEVRSIRRDRLRAKARFAPTDERVADPRGTPETQAATHEVLLAAEAALGRISDLDRATLLESLAGDGAQTPTFRKRLERATRRFFRALKGATP